MEDLKRKKQKPKQSKHGGLRNPAGGRPPLPDSLRRHRCGDITLPKWLKDWLFEQSEPAGHIIEAALIEKYGLYHDLRLPE